MEQVVKEDIAAAAAAHRELGPHYEGAVAESLVERIGEEIDKRVDARLGDRPRSALARRRRADSQLSSGPAPNWPGTVLALGSMGIGVGATAAVLDLSKTITAAGGISNPIGAGQILLCILIWVVIGAINVSYSRRH
jgi:hypothetical protein